MGQYYWVTIIPRIMVATLWLNPESEHYEEKFLTCVSSNVTYNLGSKTLTPMYTLPL